MITEITTGVYDLTLAEMNGGRYRVFLFDHETPTLVDAGLGATTDAVADRLDELGVEPERLVVTHGDPDHAGGVAALADRYDLETWVPDGVAVDGRENES
jgi:glyoxylase-like metal-dependent hydrolase (beta-lactamase superfamily II)